MIGRGYFCCCPVYKEEDGKGSLCGFCEVDYNDPCGLNLFKPPESTTGFTPCCCVYCQKPQLVSCAIDVPSNHHYPGPALLLNAPFNHEERMCGVTSEYVYGYGATGCCACHCCSKDIPTCSCANFINIFCGCFWLWGLPCRNLMRKKAEIRAKDIEKNMNEVRDILMEIGYNPAEVFEYSESMKLGAKCLKKYLDEIRTYKVDISDIIYRFDIKNILKRVLRGCTELETTITELEMMRRNLTTLMIFAQGLAESPNSVESSTGET